MGAAGTAVACVQAVGSAVGVDETAAHRRDQVAGAGAPWRNVPDCYGSWRAVYALFRRWQRAGAWAQIVTALQTRAGAAGLITWDVSVDSTIARAHQHAAGARRHPGLQQEPPGGLSAEPDDHALGRSRGGLATKIHLACEQSQKVLSLVVTAGQRSDSPHFQTVLDGINVPRIGAGRPRTRPDKVRADKAYSSRANRAYLRRRGIACTIPEPADQQQHRKSRGRRGHAPAEQKLVVVNDEAPLQWRREWMTLLSRVADVGTWTARGSVDRVRVGQSP